MLGIFGDPTENKHVRRARRGATTAMLAAMLLAGGGLAPALAAPLNQHDAGAEEQPDDAAAVSESGVNEPAVEVGDNQDLDTGTEATTDTGTDANTGADAGTETGAPDAGIAPTAPDAPPTGKPAVDTAAEKPLHDSAPGSGPGSAAQPLTIAGSPGAQAVSNPAPAATGYTLAVGSDPSDGSVVWPGEGIGYTITAANAGSRPSPAAVITVEMSGWQQAATLDAGSVKASAGVVRVVGSRLIWTTGELAAGTSGTLRYSITVDEQSADQSLVNVVTGTGDVPETVTTHLTPEYHKITDPGPEIIAPQEGTAVEVSAGPEASAEAVPATEPAAEPVADPSGKPEEPEAAPAGGSPATKHAAVSEAPSDPTAGARQLPETGAGDGPVLMAAAGSGVLLTGAVLLFLARRRAGASN